MTRGRLTACVVAVSLLATAVAEAAHAQASPAPPAGAARLQGHFQMTGRVTAARGVRGEHVGQHVRRSWTFTPACPSGPCATVTLVRNRTHGTDTVVLHRRAPGFYKGTASFFAPLRCGGKTFAHGERVPFTISVRITGTGVADGSAIATRIHATYTNRSRTNRTACVLPPSHDSAKYNGQLVSS